MKVFGNTFKVMLKTLELSILHFIYHIDIGQVIVHAFHNTHVTHPFSKAKYKYVVIIISFLI